MNFEFAAAGRILFGSGKLAELGASARALGTSALVVTGRNPGRAAPALKQLREHGVSATTFAVAGEPEIQTVRDGVELARKSGSNLVVGFGGGSAIDTAKAIAAMLTNDGDVLDYLEIIGGGKTLAKRPLPVIAMPTTAGTGAEVTRNSVLASPGHRVKVSLRSPLMLPGLVIIDPELTCELPALTTATTGLDALTQLIEPYVCKRANPMTDALCARAIPLAARSLMRAVENGRDLAARSEMCLASLFSGMALANAGLGAVHGFAGPLGGMFPAPHGAVCAALLPHVMAANLRALRERAPQDPALRRYHEIAAWLTGKPDATADDGVAWVRQLVRDLKIPGLGSHGLTASHSAEVVEKARHASSMKPNPVELSAAELAQILNAAW